MPKIGDDEELMTIETLAKYLKVSRSTVYKLIKRKGFPVIRISPRKPRFYRHQVMEWLQREAMSDSEISNQREI